MGTNTTQTCIAGEYYVLAELARRDAIASMTLRNSKGVDILVAPLGRQIAYKVEVKTTRNKLAQSKIWCGGSRFLQWRLSEKNEFIRDPSLIYVFVWLPKPPLAPRFFLVKSAEVAKYVRWEHKHWLRTRKGKDVDMRQFRIREDDMPDYENRWELLGIPRSTDAES